jgi:two-component system NtrC family response regulator
MLILPPDLLAFVKRAAASTAPVLLSGETGTGKTVLAEQIHCQSPRAAGPFVVINCPSISPSLFERELFGHTAGAYTDAKRDERGLLESADKGTVLLDEIGDLSLELQAKLLHVIDRKRIRRLGSARETAIDVRFICATNCDLIDCVSRHAFRADLYYRLSVLCLTLPPLRKRKDIVDLAEAFLAHCGADELAVGLPAQVIHALKSYQWPGNIRELETALLVATSWGSGPIHLADLPAEVRRRPAEGELEGEHFLRRSVEEQRLMLSNALIESGGNRTRAAAQLRISRSTLWLKSKLFRLQYLMPVERDSA